MPSIWTLRIRTWPCVPAGVFAAAGTVLVAIGVFSVMAYSVSRQTREIAVRMALGATRGEIMRIVVRFGGRLLSAGVIVGLAGGSR